MLQDIVVNMFEISTASEENVIDNDVNAQILVKTNVLMLVRKRNFICINLQEKLS